ncbi:MAG: hypothetical protein KDA55_12800 [Planctomycetales bacterium]|nr:hypothetical protein [Planctomycetales bacterium]MCA9221891.1 hypothetical protein [Planctomycetales bacterium]
MKMTKAALCLAPSTPGGMARHFRIQYHPLDTEPWLHFASYKDRQQAELCLRRLRQRGIPARLVANLIAAVGS